MQKETFSDIGKVAAIDRLFEHSGYSPAASPSFEPENGSAARLASRLLQEGLDFDLTYFPLKHLGYKTVVAVTGELFAALAHPRALSVRIGISAKFNFPSVQELWEGMVAAAKEYAYTEIDLDLLPCANGLSVSISAVGEELLLTRKRLPKPKSMDLLCVSGSLGAAFLGMQVLEREKKKFVLEGFQPDLEKYKMLVGSYLKPELPAGILNHLEDSEIYPSFGVLVTHGLSDAVKRLTSASGLGAKVYADKIPFEGNTFALGKELNIDPISAAMNGGDDFRLLFAVPILHAEKFRRDFQTFDVIGHLAQPAVGSVLVTPDGAELPLRAQGWPDSDPGTP
jgi:thiamine-monophosphate kinase